MQAMLNFKDAWYGYATQVNNEWVISLDFMPKILAALLALIIAIWVGNNGHNGVRVKGQGKYWQPSPFGRYRLFNVPKLLVIE